MEHSGGQDVEVFGTSLSCSGIDCLLNIYTVFTPNNLARSGVCCVFKRNLSGGLTFDQVATIGPSDLEKTYALGIYGTLAVSREGTNLLMGSFFSNAPPPPPIDTVSFLLDVFQ